MELDYPYQLDAQGHSAQTEQGDHIRDLVEQVLFTSPGERVNRPTFGSGLLQLVFSPSSDALTAATQLTVQGALQQWLGELILVEAVEVEARDSTLEVTVRYQVRRTQKRNVAQLRREV